MKGLIRYINKKENEYNKNRDPIFLPAHTRYKPRSDSI